MGFQKGHKLSPGRPKGSKNAQTLRAEEICREHNFQPLVELIGLYREAKKTYDNYGIIYDAISQARDDKNHETGKFAAPTEDKADKYLKIAADLCKEITGYVHAKKQSVALSNEDGEEGLKIVVVDYLKK